MTSAAFSWGGLTDSSRAVFEYVFGARVNPIEASARPTETVTSEDPFVSSSTWL